MGAVRRVFVPGFNPRMTHDISQIGGTLHKREPRAETSVLGSEREIRKFSLTGKQRFVKDLDWLRGCQNCNGGMRPHTRSDRVRPLDSSRFAIPPYRQQNEGLGIPTSEVSPCAITGDLSALPRGDFTLLRLRVVAGEQDVLQTQTRG